MGDEGKHAWIGTALRGLVATVGSVAATLALFLILPVMSTISSPPTKDLMVSGVDIANVPPPPPPPPEPEQEEEEPPEEPPKLEPEAKPLDLSQLELSLDPGMGSGAFADFAIDLGAGLETQDGDGLEQIFSLADLDQKPRVLFQRAPRYPQELRAAGRQGTVTLLFTVDTDGRVVDPKVQRSTDPAFEKPALEAVRQWRFEPGTRKGEAVPFRMRIPITFNAG